MRGIGFQVVALAALVACGSDGVGASAGTSGNAGASGSAGGHAGAGGTGTSGAGAGGHAGGSAGGASSSGAGNGGGGAGGGADSAGDGADAATGEAGGDGGGAGGSAALTGAGTITYERWEGVKGEDVSLVPVGEAPDVTEQLMAFQMPDDAGEDFGARLRGLLTAPMTGQYSFWLSCDDNGELSISADESPAGKQRIAYVSGSPAWTDYVEWDKFPTQKSAVVSLVAGKRYYVEALLKEDILEDHLAVGWLKPGELGSLPSEIVPGKQLSPFVP
jgi:hypothetical protein